MKKPTEMYKVLNGNRRTLENKVNDYIADGYVPFGSVCSHTSRIYGDGGDQTDVSSLIQVVVRPEILGAVSAPAVPAAVPPAPPPAPQPPPA